MSYLELTSYVNDFTKTIPQEVLDNFNQKFSGYDKKEGVQIATVFIKHRKGRELKEIALEIFNENGIGDEQTNSGLLLIVVTEEKKIRIMTGKGMEMKFPDSYCRDIIEQELRPLLNESNFEELVKVWLKVSMGHEKYSNENYKRKRKYTTGDRIGYGLFTIIALVYFGGFIMGIVEAVSQCNFMQANGVIIAMIIFVSFFYFKMKGMVKPKSLACVILLFPLIGLGSMATAHKIENTYREHNITVCEGKPYNLTFSQKLSSAKSESSSSSSNSSSSYSSSSSISSSSSWGGGSSNGGGSGD